MNTQRTVLILDDDTGVLHTVAHALQSEGYVVRRAQSRQAFDAQATDPAIDIFLIDVMLPDGSGLDVARELRSRSDAGIIIVTGRGEEIDRVIGLELGADDYVTKPFHVRELRARVNAVYRRTAPLRRLTRRHDPATGDVLTFHGWTMEVPARRLISPEGHETEVTTLEFDVLRVLVSRPNRVQSRNQIMDEVRGQNWAAYDRIVDGVVSRLRRKLFPNGTGRQRIKTIRGHGYMLSTDG